MSFLRTLINIHKNKTKNLTLKSSVCDTQLYTDCKCYDDEFNGFQGTFSSFYTNWSLILICISFAITVFVVIFQKYLKNEIFNYILSPIILSSVANSFTVFVLSQFLYFNIKIEGETSKEIKVDTEIYNEILLSNFLVHQLPFIGALGILFLFQFIKLKSYRKPVYIIGTSIILLFMLTYTLVPIKDEEDTNNIFIEKIKLVYGVNDIFIVGLLICFIIVYGLIVYSLCRIRN